MTAIIQTQIFHDYANGTFIYVYCIDQNSRYALGHECSRIPHANTKVVLYEKSGKRPEIVGCLSHIIEHWEDSVKILIIPSIHSLLFQDVQATTIPATHSDHLHQTHHTTNFIPQTVLIHAFLPSCPKVREHKLPSFLLYIYD
jgi:hypothetical protein